MMFCGAPKRDATLALQKQRSPDTRATGHADHTRHRQCDLKPKERLPSTRDLALLHRRNHTEVERLAHRIARDNTRLRWTKPNFRRADRDRQNTLFF